MGRRAVQTKVTATLQAQAPLGSPERGLLVLGGLCVAIFAVSLWRLATSPLAILGIVVGLGGFVTLFIVWVRDGHRFGQAGVPVALAQTGETVTVTTEVEPSRAIEALATIRDIVQNRKPLPDPHGRVEASPADEKTLQAFSETAQREEGESMRAKAEQHSRLVVAEIEKAQRALMAPAGVESVESEPVGPIPRREPTPPRDKPG